MQYANVAVHAPVNILFTYKLEEGVSLSPGMRVLVPFRGQKKIGICMGLLDSPPQTAFELKAIEEVLDKRPALSEKLLQLIKWVSDYYIAPIGEVIKIALPPRLMGPKTPKTTRPTVPQDIKAILGPQVTLNKEQAEAVRIISSTAGQAAVFLLDGITGSGKTEVYLSIFEKMLADGKGCLLLVPEIGLTPQLVGRAALKFGSLVGVYHSSLTDAQRHGEWQAIHEGRSRVVIGTRSALFAPVQNLGAIVVDEEHDASYKQDDGVMYHARDSAVMRAHMEGALAVLGSATPSVESVENVRRGKYRRCYLPVRPGLARLPLVEVVDMRAIKTVRGTPPTDGTEKRREFVALTSLLYDAIERNLGIGEQTLLFVGRRGFAGAIQCAACGFVPKCPNCDISLAMHLLKRGRTDSVMAPCNSKNSLVCHYCGYGIAEPTRCPECASDCLMPVGHGTQRLEAELKDFFPKARIARLDSDTVTRTSERRRILDGMREGRIDILVGTQMVTKGHDFPDVTLVGVVQADMSLMLPDFRASERTFQLMTQVAGRAGRGEKPGRVIIQTYNPGHISLVAASSHNSELFAAQELTHRKTTCYPPFTRLANIRVSATDEKVSREAANLAFGVINGLKKGGFKVEILGPAPAPIFKLRGRHRWQILVKAPSVGVLGRLLSKASADIVRNLPRKVRFAIDVDPINLL